MQLSNSSVVTTAKSDPVFEIAIAVASVSGISVRLPVKIGIGLIW